MRTRIAIAPVLLLVLAGCNSSSKDASVGTTSTPAPVTTTAAVTGAAPTDSRTAGATPTKTASSSATASSDPSATPTVSAAPATSAAPAVTSAPGKAATSKATPAGTYTYTSSGYVKSPLGKENAAGTETLTVSKLAGDIQHTSLSTDSSGSTDETVIVRDGGNYLSDLKLTVGQNTEEVRPSPAALLVPDPAKVGASWSFSGTTTDGKAKITESSKITKTEHVTVGGKSLPTFVVLTHLVITGEIDFTADITTDYVQAGRLAVKTHTVGNGTYDGAPFSADVTAIIKSTTPS